MAESKNTKQIAAELTNEIIVAGKWAGFGDLLPENESVPREPDPKAKFADVYSTIFDTIFGKLKKE